VRALPATRCRAAAARSRDRAAGGSTVPLALWQAASSNEATVNGRLLLGGKPVVGARMGVDRYTAHPVNGTRPVGSAFASTRPCPSATRCESSTRRARGSAVVH
jgi:hypothetical protein